ncbi:FAD-dependent monooxygenase [Marinobacter sp. C2H3]|uniref:FAD-dependent monooxygenase n=1 Tax=Marinobacter sp. C2H3 TaxID=3119003 RepID=UPI00300ECBE8
MTHTHDIAIVGAGMVGAALAIGLAGDGYRVALIDPAAPSPFSSDDPPDLRVSALSAGSEAYLRALGAWPGILERRATPYRRLAVWDETSHPLAALLPRRLAEVTFTASALGRSHLGHIVENRITQLALWDQAVAQPNVTLYTGTRVSGLAHDNNAAQLRLDSGDTLRAALVVGADGAQSRVRELAGIGVTRDQYAQQAMVLSVRYHGPVEDITWQGFYPTGPRAFLPLHGAGDGRSHGSLVWYDDPATLARLKSLDTTELMATVQRAFPDDLPQLAAIDGCASFPIARQHAKAYHQDRVVLVGDAAHTINPLAGQGVNLGFQDAECLQSLLKDARRSGQDPAAPALLARYERQRRPANRRMMLAMDAFYHLFSNRIPPVHLLRNLGLGAARALPFARHQVARYAMGLDDPLPATLRRMAEHLPAWPGAR